MKNLKSSMFLHFYGKILILLIVILFNFLSCTKDTIIDNSKTSGKNLVIITDTDIGSYIMVKIIGKIRSVNPDIQITFLESKIFDIYEGAFLLETAMESFPAGTVLAGIIEPGAGGRRIVYEAGSMRVFSPDNNLSSLIFKNFPGTSCYFVENPAVLGGFQPGDLSFEDFYAYSICSLISEAPGPKFGSLCSNPNTFTVQKPTLIGDSLLGQILFVDNFGNCITNIPDSLSSRFPLGTTFKLKSDTTQFNLKLGTTYSSVPLGENVCFNNSSKFLELAINFGNFSDKYKINAGTIFQLIKSQ